MKICVRGVFCFIRIAVTRMIRQRHLADMGTLAPSYLRDIVKSLEVASDWSGIS